MTNKQHILVHCDDRSLIWALWDKMLVTTYEGITVQCLGAYPQIHEGKLVFAIELDAPQEVVNAAWDFAIANNLLIEFPQVMELEI